MSFFASGVAATAKGGGSLVTEADTAVEQLLRQRIFAVRPSDAAWGEKYGLTADSDRVWIVEPIDGTGLFSRGDPNWRIDLALQINGVTEVRQFVLPALGVCWWAIWAMAYSNPLARTGNFRRLATSSTCDPEVAVLEAFEAQDERTFSCGFVVRRPRCRWSDRSAGNFDGFSWSTRPADVSPGTSFRTVVLRRRRRLVLVGVCSGRVWPCGSGVWRWCG
ncbi:inositol monophosphatase family protein [Gordonia zhaorongruii]|uniref:inositol monophosphatase family protein n=1 Tax=Gordonia zhaorongruii TaxID=2597659 RepID=UPI003CC835CC